MRPKDRLRQAFVPAWLLTWTVPVAVQLVFSLTMPNTGIYGSVTFLFWLVVIAATGCVVTSGAVLLRAFRRQEAELGYLGLFFLAVSILPLVHGLTTPGVLYQQNSATMASVQWSIPAALVVAAPVLLPGALQRKQTTRIWLAWSVFCLLGLGIGAVTMLVKPNLIPVFEARSAPAILIAFVAVVGCVLLSKRHLYLAQVAGSRSPLIMSIGYGFVGGSGVVWFGAESLSLPFWFAHALDILGVVAGSVGALIALRSTSNVRSVIDPVLAAEPLAALELGIDPIVHRFVADLETCDRTTRDHVVRTAELAVKVGMELGLSGRELRKLGLTAMLHDLGKLEIPNQIINKPDRLTDREYAIMKRHSEFGQALVETSPALREIGVLVRCHHERIDGNGYPDGRIGETIPLISRIVAVCDSFDAMANNRQYRDGMGTEKALAILREHAGTQWDKDVVAAAERVIRRTPPSEVSSFDSVGRGDNQEAADPAAAPVGCDCLPSQAMASAF